MDRGVGKLVRGALYIHKCALPRLDEVRQLQVQSAAELVGEFVWNVARIEPRNVVGFLNYPDFDCAAFPLLASAARVSVADRRVRITCYARSTNPMVLHRKELLVDENHPCRGAWAETTQRVLQAGLLRDSTRIGRFSTWSDLLAAAGFNAQGEQI